MKTTILKLKSCRYILLSTLRQQLEFRNWRFERSSINELYFILGNREIFTSELNDEQLYDIILEVVFW